MIGLTEKIFALCVAAAICEQFLQDKSSIRYLRIAIVGRILVEVMSLMRQISI